MGYGAFVVKIREKLAEKLRSEGKLAPGEKLTQKEFAKLVGAHEVTVSKWESGDIAVKLKRIEKMLKLIHPKLTLDQCLAFPDEALKKEEELQTIVREEVARQLEQQSRASPKKAKG